MWTVTTVDSGKKALEFLGMMDKENEGSPIKVRKLLLSGFPRMVIQFRLFHQAADVNLILTDYCMPEMTGYDLLKRVKVTCF